MLSLNRCYYHDQLREHIKMIHRIHTKSHMPPQRSSKVGLRIYLGALKTSGRAGIQRDSAFQRHRNSRIEMQKQKQRNEKFPKILHAICAKNVLKALCKVDSRYRVCEMYYNSGSSYLPKIG